jgi:hypothetical protein
MTFHYKYINVFPHFKTNSFPKFARLKIYLVISTPFQSFNVFFFRLNLKLTCCGSKTICDYAIILKLTCVLTRISKHCTIVGVNCENVVYGKYKDISFLLAIWKSFGSNIKSLKKSSWHICN